MKSIIFKAAVAASLFLVAGAANAADTFQEWENKLRSKIASTNTYPADALSEGVEGTVKVRLKFAQNGDIEGVEFVEKSGSETLDRKAFQMALRIRNMPALPEGRDTVSLVVPLTFALRDKS